MEVWVRSQDRCALQECRHLSVQEVVEPNKKRTEWAVVADFAVVGEYETKERCLEIIDEIQGLFGYTLLASVSADGSIKNEYHQRKTAVYEMPKE